MEEEEVVTSIGKLIREFRLEAGKRTHYPSNNRGKMESRERDGEKAMCRKSGDGDRRY